MKQTTKLATYTPREIAEAWWNPEDGAWSARCEEDRKLDVFRVERLINQGFIQPGRKPGRKGGGR